MFITCGKRPAWVRYHAINPCLQISQICCNENGEKGYGKKTIQTKRFSAGLRPDPGSGALRHGDVAHVSVAVGDMVQYELPVDEPVALWCRVRAEPRG